MALGVEEAVVKWMARLRFGGRPRAAVFRSGRGRGKVDGTSLVWRRPHTTVFLLNDATMGKFLDLTIFQKAGSWICSCLGTICILSFGSDF